jgi:predicted ATPase
MGDPLDALEGLVAQSLVIAQAGPDGEPRYTMLETIRAFALEQLAAGDDEAPARRRVLAFLSSLIETLAPQLQGPSYPAAREQLIGEWPNIAASLE